jgi:FKBP-type peptidyl-prolyl cis-trans isomerase
MSKILRPALLAAALTATLGVSLAHAAPALTTEKAKNSYLVGMDLASGIPPLVRQELDPAIVADALRTVLSGQKPAMSEAEAKTVRAAFMKKLQAKAEAARAQESKTNEVQGAAFLAKNKTAPGVKTLPDGLQYEVMKMGTGPKPTASDTVQINYTGTFINGQKFDASADHGGPASIPLANVIPGFREGLTMFPVGSHFKLFIPANLAYGANPPGPMPPNATLIFDIETLKIMPAQAADQAAAPAGGNK